MKGVAARYPKMDPGAARLVNPTINRCRRAPSGGPTARLRIGRAPGLDRFVAHQSRGMPLPVTLDSPEPREFRAAGAISITAQGQMNLSCSPANDRNWGGKLAARS